MIIVVDDGERNPDVFSRFSFKSLCYSTKCFVLLLLVKKKKKKTTYSIECNYRYANLLGTILN